jgi:hypothetical protein
MKDRNHNIHNIILHFESSDTSVGIMTEGFSACRSDDNSWCNIEDIQDDLNSTEFKWYDSETGNVCNPPEDAWVVEAALYGFAIGFYNNQERIWIHKEENLLQ